DLREFTVCIDMPVQQVDLEHDASRIGNRGPDPQAGHAVQGMVCQAVRADEINTRSRGATGRNANVQGGIAQTATQLLAVNHVAADSESVSQAPFGTLQVAYRQSGALFGT